ncbi:MAG: hypothetical protein PHO79_04460 [Desulfoplanes sp.]|nr:hypothetical protein [Desulfoplanes sp.]
MSQIDNETFQGLPGNPVLLSILVVFLFCFFGLRLWYLQIYRGDYFDRKSRDNRIRRNALYAPRGLLRDTNNVLLAENKPSYALSLVREDCPDVEKTLAQVAAWVQIPLEQLRKDYVRGKKRVKPFANQILVPNISFAQVAIIESHALDWPGLKILVRPRRSYPQGPLMSHILGYVAQANEEELNKDSNLALGDNVGKLGLEYTLESKLTPVICWLNDPFSSDNIGQPVFRPTFLHVALSYNRIPLNVRNSGIRGPGPFEPVPAAVAAPVLASLHHDLI